MNILTQYTATTKKTSTAPRNMKPKPFKSIPPPIDPRYPEANVVFRPATHTPAATRLAEILIPEGIDRKGSASRIQTAYGEKTRLGIADMIDRETGLPELLEAVRLAAAALSDRGRWVSGDAQAAYLACSRALAKAEGRA